MTKNKIIKVGRINVFYREAGAPSAATILLLHGFPTSSHMFRNLIPVLPGSSGGFLLGENAFAENWGKQSE